ncbi:MAG TPA: AarF/ABC1/UbiB kinase family protein, partial [Actinomycetota bacterium]
MLTRELGDAVEAVFAEFERQPLAAASVAQVHRARLQSGAEVVVKVQRPGIRQVVERDLDIIARLARSLERGTRWGRPLGVRDLAAGFATAVREELDFRIEAGNMAAVAASRGSSDGVLIPTPYEPLCTQRVLVMQRLDGTPPGDGRLGLLDFGSVGRLDPSLRAALQRLLLAMDRGDPLAASDALLEVVPRPTRSTSRRWSARWPRWRARSPGWSPGSTWWPRPARSRPAT